MKSKHLTNVNECLALLGQHTENVFLLFDATK